ncbi:hypothetical protein INT47_001070 [Mucor saturninus]|uniref:Uncharacterized protein n=1 Tax=Mucor saturninus TaxID=64648 RepID=A0A8H7V0A3_9FUNG|nr:hypothetical protein INT47_001070 [Mucor saturninus]
MECLNSLPEVDKNLTFDEYCQRYGLEDVNEIEAMMRQEELVRSRDLNTNQNLSQNNELIEDFKNKETEDSLVQNQLPEDVTNKPTNMESIKTEEAQITLHNELQSVEPQSAFTNTVVKKRIEEAHDLVIKKSKTNHEEIPPNHGAGPLFVHFESEDHATVSICLDPNRAMTGKFKVNATTDILKHWNETQRAAVRDQIQDLQDQLTQLKDELL